MKQQDIVLEDGFTAAWSGLLRQQLVEHLAAFLAQPGVVGLVEGLAAALWLHGQSDNRARVYALGATAPNGKPEITTGITSESVGADELLDRWPSGRLFHPAVEWRWQLETTGTYRLFGLAEDATGLTLATARQAEPDHPALLSTPTRRAGWRVSKSTQQLVGSTIVKDLRTPAASAWGEVRNPRPLLYPLDHENHPERQPRLEVRVYATERQVVRFIRYCKVYYEPK